MQSLSLKNNSGFSLVELIVATAAATVIAAGSGAVMINAVKDEQKAQAVADAARAADVLKRTVFNPARNMNNCSNNLQLVDGAFNANNLTGNGIRLRVPNIPAFGGNAESGAVTPYGEIVDFRVLSDNANPEFEDVDGNSVYSGVVMLSVRRGPGFPTTPIFLGSLGLRIDPINGAFQGCANAIGETGVAVRQCGANANARFLRGGPVGNFSCGTSVPESAVNSRCPNEPTTCPPGQALVAVDTDTTDLQDACMACRNIVEPVRCGDCVNAADCPGRRTPRGLKGFTPEMAHECEVLPQDDVDQRITATPTPNNSLPNTEPPMPTPVTPTPVPTAYPTVAPTSAPAPPPPAPAPNNSCGAEAAATACQEICIYEGWLGYGAVGNNCFTICPTNASGCPVPIIMPNTTIVPPRLTPTPSPTPTPVNTQCSCGGQVINEGEYCGSCIQFFEPELGIGGRAYNYIDRRQSFRCINGNLVLGGVNPNAGNCPVIPGGGIGYEYWY